MTSPLLVMVAGPNGAGKTTLIQALQAAGDVVLPERYVNADELGAREGIDARSAQRRAQQRRREAIAERASLLYETVMSHPSKIAELQLAARAGYAITVIYVGTVHPEVNIERVRLRVAAGGHPVPEERIRARHRRSLALAPAALAFADHAYVYDNSAWGSEAGPPLQALLVQARLEALARPPSSWVIELMRRVNARADELAALYRETADPLALPDLDRGVAEGPMRRVTRHYAVQRVALPDLDRGVAEGPMRRVTRHYAVQRDRASAALLLHDRLLLTQPVLRGRGYRIAYDEGVATVSARRSAAVKPVAS